MPPNFNFNIEFLNAGERLDKFLILKLPEFSRTRIQKIIENECVIVDGKIENKKYLLKAGQNVEVKVPESKKLEILPQNIPLDIIFEDENLLVVNKPKGMVTHPCAGHYEGTLVNALLYHCGKSLSGINGILRPGILHRLDKDTSGLLVVAKNDFAHNFLADQIKNHNFKKEYEAVVYGTLKDDKGIICTKIGRHKTDRKKMAVLNFGGKEAITYYEVIQTFEKYTHVKLTLKTGRTHQIRVHMAYLGNPIVGDNVYSKKKNEFKFLKGQCLHAKTLGFNHPKTKEYLEFLSDLPEYFKKVLNSVRSFK